MELQVAEVYADIITIQPDLKLLRETLRQCTGDRVWLCTKLFFACRRCYAANMELVATEGDMYFYVSPRILTIYALVEMAKIANITVCDAVELVLKHAELKSYMTEFALAHVFNHTVSEKAVETLKKLATNMIREKYYKIVNSP